MTLTVNSARYAMVDNSAYIAETQEKGSVAGVVGDALWAEIERQGVSVAPFTPPTPTDGVISVEGERRVSSYRGIDETIRVLADYVAVLRANVEGTLSPQDSSTLDDYDARLKDTTDHLGAAEDLRQTRPFDYRDDKYWPLARGSQTRKTDR